MQALEPVCYSFPVQLQGEKASIYCEAQAMCSLGDFEELVCNFSFKVLSLSGKPPSDIEFDTSAISLKMLDRELSLFFKDFITIDKIPLYRGIYSFNELPLILHSFILPSFKGSLMTGDTGKRVVKIERDPNFGMLYEETIMVNGYISVRAR